MRPRHVATDGSITVGNARDLNDLMPMGDYHSVWRSPEDFARHFKDIPASDYWDSAGREGGNERFYGTGSWEDTLKLATNGWTEGAEQIEKMRDRILAQNPVAQRAVKYGIAGSVPDVPRAVSGALLNMKDLDTSRSKKRPVLTIVSNMAANCGVEHTTISNRAAVVAALIDQIESAGFACEVVATALSSGWGKGRDGKSYKAATSVRVKESFQPVDTKRLAFGLGHASMFRRMIFADWTAERANSSGLGPCLGHSEKNQIRTDLVAKKVYFLPSAEGKTEYFKDAEASATIGLQFLIWHLKKQGCPAFRDYKFKPEVLEKLEPKKTKSPLDLLSPSEADPYEDLELED